MSAVSLTLDDLTPFATVDPARGQAMIDDALALAARVAPCIIDDEFEYADAARAVLRGAILRWHDSGSGAITQQTAGPFGQTFDTRTERRSLFWPSEIGALQELCRDGDLSSQAFDIDTISVATPVHADICALNFGALYCSCGAILTMYLPLYENFP